MKGRVHSIESFGTVDGPGIRMVIFLQGCPMRCLYCHNPDTWAMEGGTFMTVNEIIRQFEASRHFYATGGITVTGGEPLMQIDFVTELFQAASHRNIHTCLDTSGITFNPDNETVMEKMDKLMTVTDLVMLDIKHIDPREHIALTGQKNERILLFARYLDERAIPVWIRHVVVPGITDQPDFLYRLGLFIGELHNVKVLDVLPYHDMGEIKYQELGMDYPLKDVLPLDKEDGIAARKIILKGIRDKRLTKTKKNCSEF